MNTIVPRLLLVLVIAGALILVMFSAKTEGENVVAKQGLRWFVFLGLMFCAGLSGAIFVKGITGVTSLSVIVGAITLAMTLSATYGAFLMIVPGNRAYLADDKWFGETGENGIRIYRVFLGGLKCKFPQEVVEIDLDLNRDVEVPFKFLCEFKGSTGMISGMATLRPLRTHLQNFVLTSIDEEVRNRILVNVYKTLLEMAISDVLKIKEIAWVMENKSLIPALATAHRAQEFAKTSEDYGVYMNTFIVGDVDFTTRVQEAHEQTAVMKRLVDAARQYLIKMRGYTEDNVDNADKRDLALAMEIVQVNLGKVAKNVVDVRGLEGLSGKTLEGAATIVAANRWSGSKTTGKGGAK